MLKIILIIILAIFYSISIASWEPIAGKKGMVATADKHATQVGIEVLKNGGNAIDAAVAVGFALAVTYPRAGNIGGGGFMVIRNPKNEIYSIDYREKAPLAASRDMYLDKNKNIIKNLSLTGYLASGVPGTVSGLFEAHKKYGTLDWEVLVNPAIKLAEQGIVIDRYLASALEYHYERFIKFPSSVKIFTNNGEKFSEGDMLIQTDLANTLKLIRDYGTEGFYEGKIASLFSEDMRINNGIITEEDLSNYRSIWRDPINFTYRNHSIYSMAPPSSGGIIIGEILNTLENYDISEMGSNSSNLIHIWAEVEKQAYADRAEYLGDADFVKIPQDKLISKNYAYTLFQNVNPFYSTSSAELGDNQIQNFESSQTTHFSIVDQWGNAVSSTYTLNGSFGSGVVIEGTGILMNNEMDDFSIKAGSANLYGLLGSEANEIVPEKRMLSSMTPTIITKNDSLFMILGTPGGSTIITSVAQVISNVIDHKMNIRIAVESPRFHHQWLPDEIKYEKNRLSVDVINNLKNKGNKLNPVGRIGDIQAIIWNSQYNEWQGWSDPRGNGKTKGY
jgi:gamma-glutamyltranspeptidase / glutathione hydrolase